MYLILSVNAIRKPYLGFHATLSERSLLHLSSNRKAMNRNSGNQKANPALKYKAGNK